MTGRRPGKARPGAAAVVGGRRWSVSRRIAAPAPVVWRLLTDIRFWPLWGPSITGAELAGHRPGGEEHVLRAGSRGRVRTVVGLSLPFIVTSFEEGSFDDGSFDGRFPEVGRAWSWAVAGVAATGHRVGAAPGGCLVTFSVPWWAPPYLLVCAVALRRIDRLAAQQARDALDCEP